jgi:hypothetical protein
VYLESLFVSHQLSRSSTSPWWPDGTVTRHSRRPRRKQRAAEPWPQREIVSRFKSDTTRINRRSLVVEQLREYLENHEVPIAL